MKITLSELLNIQIFRNNLKEKSVVIIYELLAHKRQQQQQQQHLVTRPLSQYNTKSKKNIRDIKQPGI